MQIDYYPKYIVDACVMLAYTDEKEPHHAEALDFFVQLDSFAKSGKRVEMVIPAHFYLEVNLNVMRKRRDAQNGSIAYKFRNSQEGVSARTPYPITPLLMKQIEERGLYEKFAFKLKVGDFIYAAIAYLESIPLVTLDKTDFTKVATDVKVIFLTP